MLAIGQKHWLLAASGVVIFACLLTATVAFVIGTCHGEPTSLPISRQEAPERTSAGDWPHLRGPQNDGVSQESGLLDAWPASARLSSGRARLAPAIRDSSSCKTERTHRISRSRASDEPEFVRDAACLGTIGVCRLLLDIRAVRKLEDGVARIKTFLPGPS
jgi:hypothetical protein